MCKQLLFTYFCLLFFLFFLFNPLSLLLSQQNADDLVAKANAEQQAGNQKNEAAFLNKAGILYWSEGKLKKAANAFKRSAEINQSLGNTNGLKTIYGHLGAIYAEMQDHGASINFYEKAFQLSVNSNNVDDIISLGINMANVYQEAGSYTESSKKAKKALERTLGRNDLSRSADCYEILAHNAEKLGKSAEAKEYYDKYNSISKHLQKQHMEQLAQKSKQFEQQVVRKEKELKSARDTLGEVVEMANEIKLQNELLNKENELKELVIKQEQAKAEAERKQNLLIYTVFGVFLLGLTTVIFLVLKQVKQKKKANQILRDTNAQIENQKEEIEKQRDLANKQKKRITDSIQYAKRIQKAVMPPQSLLYDTFQDHFILFKPKDIVSGDFFWYTRKEHLLIIAAADCTGHGVPGAFMSMLGVAYLNDIVNRVVVNKHINTLNVDKILFELRERVISSLHQTGAKNEPKDGMDIALCIFDLENKKLQYAGAHNPLVLVRNGELERFSADKMPVSYHQLKDKPFTKKEIRLLDGDCIYIFSDGYVDQFGGPKGSKYLAKRFDKTLLEINAKPMAEQKQVLEENMEAWMGDKAQVDDMIVIGIRFQGLEKPKKKGGSWEDRNILIAEDTDVNYILLAEVLKRTNAKLDRVKNGAEAVEFVKVNPVDLVLMDINMPEMNGYDATRKIKAYKKEIPVVVQTAMHDGEERDTAKEAGADDFISKPIDLSSFMQVLQKFLD